MPPFPLDYAARGYAYLERPNRALLALFAAHRPAPRDRPLRVLDVGCGAGANGRALREREPGLHLVGVEPDPVAARLAREVFDEVREARLEQALAQPMTGPFDVVILSDVLEHQVEPVRFLQALLAAPDCAASLFLCSVPNYAVWYNRLGTLAGRFEYAWSGLHDRTHLRFFTARSLAQMLAHVGLRTLGQRVTPSLAQSFAPLLRRRFEGAVERGDHLALSHSPAYRAYERWLEPLESSACELWPSLLGFQLVVAATPGRRRASATSCPP